MKRILTAAAVLLLGAHAASALDPSQQRGFTFVKTNCGATQDDPGRSRWVSTCPRS
jgi:hypothetical protein